MIKVSFEDSEIYEVTGDEKEVSKFVKKYLDRLDEDLLIRYDGCYMCDDDDDYEDCDDDYDEYYDLLRDPEEVMTESDKIGEKYIEIAKKSIADMIKKTEKDTDRDQKDDNSQSDDIKYYANLVTSPDYKERFIAEFNELRICMSKLKDLLNRWDAGKLDFTPSCPKELLEKQYGTMHDYYEVLKIRAHIEGINTP